MKKVEKKISEIKEDVLLDLQKQAAMLECNCILGVSIDVDEISSSQLNAYMITASGTPAVYKPLSRDRENRAVKGDEVARLYYEALSNSSENRNAARSLNQAQLIEKYLSSDPLSDSLFMECCIDLLLKDCLDNALLLQNIFENRVPAQPQMALCALERLLACEDMLSSCRNVRLQQPPFEIVIRFIGSQTSYQNLFLFMQKGGIVFQTLILLPMLEIIKPFYKKTDQKWMRRILEIIREEYWYSGPDLTDPGKNIRISSDGSVLYKAGDPQSISLASFEKRKSTALKLEALEQVLEKLFPEDCSPEEPANS